MTAHFSILAWRIPWTEECGGLQSIGSESQIRLKRLSTHTWKSNLLLSKCQHKDRGENPDRTHGLE